MVLGRRWLIAFVIVLISLLAGCGGGKDEPTSAQPIDGSFKPAASMKDAVDSVLGSMQRNDVAASFALLSPDARNEFKDTADWAERQRELPPIMGYKLEDGGDGRQVALVDHTPGLSPFVGLSPKQERQIWTGKKFEGGWLLDPEPKVEPILPADDKAPAAAKAWVEAVQACDQNKAGTLQGVSTLFASVKPTICQIPGPVTTGPVERLAEGPASTEIVAQYTADALQWARVVPVTSPLNVKVIVAPIGDDWKVIGLA